MFGIAASPIGPHLKIYICIIFLSLFIRAFNFTDRIAIESDNTRDVAVARFAFDTQSIPRIGQYSSAGPFFYGPWWYWTLSLVTLLPLGIFTHWYFILLLSLFFISGMYFLGSELGGRKLGLLAALIASISPLAVKNSLAVWNPVIIPYLVLLSLVLLVKFIKHKSPKIVFFLGFTLGIAVNIHFQSILLMPTFAVAAIFSRKPKHLLMLCLGFLLPFIPLINFDISHGFINFRNIYHYLTVGQYAIWVPNRWLTYIFDYWPNTWSLMFGGHKAISIFIMAVVSLVILLRIKHWRSYLTLYGIAALFVMELILFRYYRGERFLYYSYFAYPTVNILCAWAILQLVRMNKFLGLLIAFTSFITTTVITVSWMSPAPYTYTKIKSTITEIYNSMPKDGYSVYGCLFNGDTVSYPVAYFMYLDGKNDKNGKKIGVCEGSDHAADWKVLLDEEVQSTNSAWMNRDTETVYRETAEWWK